jgi:hypothetical protein
VFDEQPDTIQACVTLGRFPLLVGYDRTENTEDGPRAASLGWPDQHRVRTPLADPLQLAAEVHYRIEGLARQTAQPVSFSLPAPDVPRAVPD